MNINIDDSTRLDIKEFWEWIKEKDEEWFQNHQEQIFTILALLLNKRFKEKILALRKSLKIPEEWHTYKKNARLHEEYQNYNKTYPNEALIIPHDKRIIKICNNFGINIKRYYDFIVNYLYFGCAYVIIPKHFEYFEYFFAKDEYRYKTTFELDYGEDKEQKLSETPLKGYIQFYKDTTPNQMISFIKANLPEIKKIQKHLPLYPHHKKYESFKRDLQVYILYLLGEKPMDIPDIMSKNISKKASKKDVNEANIEEAQVYAIIKDFGNRIKNIFN